MPTAVSISYDVAVASLCSDGDRWDGGRDAVDRGWVGGGERVVAVKGVFDAESMLSGVKGLHFGMKEYSHSLLL